MFRDKIQNKYEELSPRFRILADFILENTLDVGFLTATELARRVGVDPATVVRFSQELGYSGYRELSREIKQYINQQLALHYQKGAAETEGLTGQIGTMLDELSDRILDMKADAGQIAQIVQTIHAAQRVLITSTAEGYHIATLWSTYLNLLGLETYPLRADYAQAAILLRDAEPGDLLIAISLGLGPDTEIGHLLGAAKEHGLHTLSITPSPTLLPARQADTNLAVPSKTPSGYPSFDTLMVVLALLWQALIAVDAENAKDNVQATLEALNDLLAQKDQVPSYDVAALLRLWGQG
ncbi:MAG TPA: MurR/RpiR family transcriptional regulator [Anaerolineae bacterium]|nr:MurR/RpiR family transcriptional regulator [Anaerolineae bacterium]HQH37743.1 MurR/RpiR family transcriptional regulator [Anaerolineae bacterium]